MSQSVCACVKECVCMLTCVSECVCLPNRVVPEDTDGFRALLSGEQPELQCDGFFQCVLYELLIIKHHHTDHRSVNDWPLRNPTHTHTQTSMCISNFVFHVHAFMK